MPKLFNVHVPSYRLHKQSGQAIVTLSGRDVLLGRHGSPESREKYNRVVAEWLAGGRQLPAEQHEITVAEVVAAFRKHARVYYRHADGTLSREVDNLDAAARPPLKLYARSPAAEFGPLKLQAVRNEIIAHGLCRTEINKRMSRVKSVFKCAVSNELIASGVYHGLLSVAGLRLGRCQARESEPVKSVPIKYVNAVLSHVSPQVAAMVQLQLLRCDPIKRRHAAPPGRGRGARASRGRVPRGRQHAKDWSARAEGTPQAACEARRASVPDAVRSGRLPAGVIAGNRQSQLPLRRPHGRGGRRRAERAVVTTN